MPKCGYKDIAIKAVAPETKESKKPTQIYGPEYTWQIYWPDFVVKQIANYCSLDFADSLKDNILECDVCCEQIKDFDVICRCSQCVLKVCEFCWKHVNKKCPYCRGSALSGVNWKIEMNIPTDAGEQVKKLGASHQSLKQELFEKQALNDNLVDEIDELRKQIKKLKEETPDVEKLKFDIKALREQLAKYQQRCQDAENFKGAMQTFLSTKFWP